MGNIKTQNTNPGNPLNQINNIWANVFQKIINVNNYTSSTEKPRESVTSCVIVHYILELLVFHTGYYSRSAGIHVICIFSLVLVTTLNTAPKSCLPANFLEQASQKQQAHIRTLPSSAAVSSVPSDSLLSPLLSLSLVLLWGMQRISPSRLLSGTAFQHMNTDLQTTCRPTLNDANYKCTYITNDRLETGVTVRRSVGIHALTLCSSVEKLSVNYTLEIVFNHIVNC